MRQAVPSGKLPEIVSDAVELQRAYYARTADNYDDLHLAGHSEHDVALDFLISIFDRLGIRSVLDIGSGTGRALLRIKESRPDIDIVGIEPSAELRAVGHSHGLSQSELIDGDGTKLSFADDFFDLVCEFGVLHHIPKPSIAVAEMLRVARAAIFISDSNNFGQGGKIGCFVKQAINAVGLWHLADLIKTGGKGYTISEGDGVAYSYSVFNDYPQIRAACGTVQMFNTTDAGPNLYRTASHVALLGVKRLSSRQ